MLEKRRTKEDDNETRPFPYPGFFPVSFSLSVFPFPLPEGAFP
jgi:hypothetical protein